MTSSSPEIVVTAAPDRDDHPPTTPSYIVAEGLITPEPSPDSSRYVFSFRSKVRVCGKVAGEFRNDVKCRKWTDLTGKTSDTPSFLPPAFVPQPPKGGILNVGDVTIKVGSQTIKCPDFTLNGIQTYGVALDATEA